jgi:hypothetical protein
VSWSTDVFGSGQEVAERRVQAIIAANELAAPHVAAQHAPAPEGLLASNEHLGGAARHLH